MIPEQRQTFVFDHRPGGLAGQLIIAAVYSALFLGVLHPWTLRTLSDRWYIVVIYAVCLIATGYGVVVTQVTRTVVDLEGRRIYHRFFSWLRIKLLEFHFDKIGATTLWFRFEFAEKLTRLEQQARARAVSDSVLGQLLSSGGPFRASAMEEFACRDDPAVTVQLVGIALLDREKNLLLKLELGSLSRQRLMEALMTVDCRWGAYHDRLGGWLAPED